MKKLFIHIPKNGGTSLRHTKHNIEVNNYRNSQLLNPFDVKKELAKVDLGPSYGHVRLRDFHQSFVLNHQPFCIVRNPWDREVSKYKFLLHALVDGRAKVDHRKRLFAEYAHDSDGTSVLSFPEYLQIRHKFKDVPYTWLHAVESFWSQKSYIVDHNDQVKADVLRFEEYDHDVARYLGVKVTEKANQMKKDDYRKYYISDTYDIVADIYKEDIEYFDFEFESSARKNFWKA